MLPAGPVGGPKKTVVFLSRSQAEDPVCLTTRLISPAAVLPVLPLPLATAQHPRAHLYIVGQLLLSMLFGDGLQPKNQVR